MPTDVVTRDFEAVAPDGARLLLRWYVKTGSAPGAAVYYVHGGGMILSNVSIYDRPVPLLTDRAMRTSTYFRRRTMKVSVRGLLRVFLPLVGTPHGVHEGRPPEVLPSPPP